MDNILYVSSLCSGPMMSRLFDSALEKPHPAPQKFHSLLVSGLVESGVRVTSLVALPVTLSTHPNKKWWRRVDERIDGVHYIYIPFYNHPIPKLLGFKIFAFFYTIFWIIRTKGSKAVVCDVLYTHSFAAMNACRLFGVKCAGIVTDIPGMMTDKEKSSALRRYCIKRDLKNIRRMTHLVPLTDEMCDVINPLRNIPYVVIEGLVDKGMIDKAPTPYTDGKRHITYTGTINARYGVRDLIEGFMMLKQKDVVLDIYGKGPMEAEMFDYERKDLRVKYHGVVPIEEAVEAQRSSYLLVNPRPTREEFTKYSFPSKNMEYMATGVPLLTAVLPGMPKEYYPNVFLFKDETAEGLFCSMNEILSMPKEEVVERGRMGKQFVMQNKNNVRQAQRIIDLLGIE